MEKLNDDILLTIFGFLDVHSPLNSTEVCKRWNNLIFSSSHLTRRPTLAIDISAWSDDINYSNDLLTTLSQKLQTFPFRNFKLTSNSHHNTREKSIMKIFKENCQKIEKLCIDSFSCGLMLSMLRFAAPTLTHLIISTSFGDEIFIGIVDLPNLTYLKVTSISSLLKVIKCENLQTLRIEKCSKFDIFYDFLVQSKFLPKLKSLTTFYKFWMLNDLQELPFKLESLTLCEISFISSDMLHKFLLSHAKSLKSLTILSRISVPTINFILDNLRNLESLKIDGSIQNLGTDKNEIKFENFNLKNLEMWLAAELYTFPDYPELNEAKDVLEILSKCKKLERLKFQGFVSTVNAFKVNLTLPSLKTLELETIRQIDFWNCLKMPNLDSFVLENLSHHFGSFPELLSFFPAMPKLKNLQINTWPYRSFKSHEIEEIFKFLKNFESLRIKTSNFMPVEFLDHFGGFESETFKLLEFSSDEDENILEEFRDEFKDLKFQAIFGMSDRNRRSNVWEENVEDLCNFDEEDEESFYRVQKMYKNFMINSFYPNFFG